MFEENVSLSDGMIHTHTHTHSALERKIDVELNWFIIIY